jgi:hypothetical protein
MTLKERFKNDVVNGEVPHVLVVAVKLPTGVIETITNYHGLGAKIDYYTNAYDEDFRLKANKDIQIVGYMLV